MDIPRDLSRLFRVPITRLTPGDVKTFDKTVRLVLMPNKKNVDDEPRAQTKQQLHLASAQTHITRVYASLNSSC
jgi:hypothetical protein